MLCQVSRPTRRPPSGPHVPGQAMTALRVAAPNVPSTAVGNILVIGGQQPQVILVAPAPGCRCCPSAGSPQNWPGWTFCPTRLLATARPTSFNLAQVPAPTTPSAVMGRTGFGTPAPRWRYCCQSCRPPSRWKGRYNFPAASLSQNCTSRTRCRGCRCAGRCRVRGAAGIALGVHPLGVQFLPGRLAHHAILCQARRFLERFDRAFCGCTKAAIHADGWQAGIKLCQAGQPELHPLIAAPGAAAAQHGTWPCPGALSTGKGFALAGQLGKILDADIDIANLILRSLLPTTPSTVRRTASGTFSRCSRWLHQTFR